MELSSKEASNPVVVDGSIQESVGVLIMGSSSLYNVSLIFTPHTLQTHLNILVLEQIWIWLYYFLLLSTWHRIYIHKHFTLLTSDHGLVGNTDKESQKGIKNLSSKLFCIHFATVSNQMMDDGGWGNLIDGE